MDTVSGNISVSFDKKQAITRNIERLKSNMTKDLTGKLVFGLDNSSWVQVFTPQFIGSVSQLNIFNVNRNISIRNLTNGAFSASGNILSWTDTSFKFKGDGVSLEELEIEH